MVRVISFGKSDVGLKRSNNEDAFALDQDRGFMVVADGMGGAAAGEVASMTFVDTAREVLADTGGSEEKNLELVQKVFSSANERIFTQAQANLKYHGMGCTAELAVFFDQSYVIGHVGDSRTYLFRQGQLRQITKDHSLVQEQLDKGIITPDEARTHSFRNVILRAVGVGENLAVDLVTGKVQPGDCFLLCSDGLTDMVTDQAIQDILSQPYDIMNKADNLIALAKAGGGSDNITVVLCAAA